MSAPHPRQAHLVAISLTLYRTLLILYPKRFREAYGAEMTRVFRDTLRTAAREQGVSGLARVWRVALPDLVITTLAERTERTESSMPITRSALFRATGLISLLGVAVWILSFIALLLVQVIAPTLFLTNRPATSIILPTAWTFFVIGFIGLYAWLAKHRGALVWLPGVIVLTTLLAIIAGGMYWNWASQVGMTYSGSASIVNLAATSAVNQQLDYYAYVVSNQGYPVIGLALLATVWMIRSTPALRPVSHTLLVMGVVSVAYYFFTDMGAPSLLRNTGTPGALGVFAGTMVFGSVWLIGWLLLGRWLWRAGGAQGQAAAAPATLPE